ncbi:hypothetical protein BJY52DRAFT_1173188 [Lactarius psammicola]|nr:hypothetical protein BJY52DRAFT_1173188 [Lactarius psammicola]
MHTSRSFPSFDTKAPIIPRSLLHSGSFITVHYVLPPEFSGVSWRSTVATTRPGAALAARRIIIKDNYLMV